MKKHLFSPRSALMAASTGQGIWDALKDQDRGGQAEQERVSFSCRPERSISAPALME